MPGLPAITDAGLIFAGESVETSWREVAAWSLTHDIEAAGVDRMGEIDWDTLILGERRGSLRMWTLRDLAGSLVGYGIFWLFRSPHHKGEIRAQADAFFLRPGCRKGSVGREFLRACNDQLRALGVVAVIHSVRPGRDFGPVLRRLGFQPLEHLYLARL